MRGLVHPRHQGRTGGHRQAGTLRRRLETRTRCRGESNSRPQRPQGGRYRQRPRRTGLRQRPGTHGLRREDLRGAARGGRRAGLRHPGIPPAEAAGRGPRNRGREGLRRGDRNRRHRGPHGDDRLTAGRRGLRCRLHRLGGRAAALHGHPGREPQRRGLGQRVPHARQPHARLRRRV